MFSTNFITAKKAGRAFSWKNVTYDTDAADTILLVRNDRTDAYTLNIERVDISADTTTEVVVHVHTSAAQIAFTPAGTAVTGVNLKGGGVAAVATAYGDETGNTQGSVIAGAYALANVALQIETPEVELGYHQDIAVDVVTAGTGALVTVWGYYTS